MVSALMRRDLLSLLGLRETGVGHAHDTGGVIEGLHGIDVGRQARRGRVEALTTSGSHQLLGAEILLRVAPRRLAGGGRGSRIGQRVQDTGGSGGTALARPDRADIVVAGPVLPGEDDSRLGCGHSVLLLVVLLHGLWGDRGALLVGPLLR